MSGSEMEAAAGGAFEIYVDEHGTIGSGKVTGTFGFGCVVLPPADVESLRARLREVFPTGIHMKDKKPRGKRRAAEAAVGVLRDFPACFGGGVVYADPAYARAYYFEAIATMPRSALQTLADAAIPDEKSGLISPDLAPPLRDISRLLATYVPVCRYPVIALARLASTPDPFSVVHRWGIVGERRQYLAKLALLKEGIIATARDFGPYARAGVVPPKRYDTEIDVIERTEDPIFDLADVFACMAHQWMKSPRLGRQLHEILMPVLARSPWPAEKAAHGISVIRAVSPR